MANIINTHSQEMIDKVQDVVEKFGKSDRSSDAFKYYYIKYLEDFSINLSRGVILASESKKVIDRLENELNQTIKVRSWVRLMAQWMGFSSRFLLEQALRRETLVPSDSNTHKGESVIYDDGYSRYDISMSEKLAELAGTIVHTDDLEEENQARELFFKLLHNESTEDHEATDLKIRFLVNSQSDYEDILRELEIKLAHDHKTRNTLRSLQTEESPLSDLFNFLSHLHDSSNQEFDEFELFDRIKEMFFTYEAYEDSIESLPAYRERLVAFSNFLSDLFFELESSTTSSNEETDKLAMLQHFKSLINRFSDYYNLPYHIVKLKKDEKLLVKESCNALWSKLINSSFPSSLFNPEDMKEDTSLIELRKMEVSLAKTFSHRRQSKMIANDCLDLLNLIQNLSCNDIKHRTHFLFFNKDHYNAIIKKTHIDSKKIKSLLSKINKEPLIDYLRSNSDYRLKEFKEFHETIFGQIDRYILLSHDLDSLIKLAESLLETYSNLLKSPYDYQLEYRKIFDQIRKDSPTNVKAIKKLCYRMSQSIKQRQVEEQSTSSDLNLNLIPYNRQFQFVRQDREHNHTRKKARRIDKKIIRQYTSPIRITLATFQAVIAFGGAYEFLSIYLASALAFGIGGAAFCFSWISNNQLVSLPLQKVLEKILLDGKISQSESRMARAFSNIAFFLAIGTGLAMAMVGTSFGLSLFLNPSMAILITLAFFNIIPTTLGFGALLFKNFEEFVFSSYQFLVSLNLDKIKLFTYQYRQKLANATLEDKWVAIIITALIPLIIGSVVTFGCVTTAAMISAWYVKVSTLFIVNMGLSSSLANSLTFGLVITCAAPIRLVFNIKNMNWCCFFVADAAVRYLIVKPILFPFKAMNHLYHHGAILMASLPSLWNPSPIEETSRSKRDSYADEHYKEIHKMQTVSWFSKYATLWSAVVFNCLATGMSALRGGPKIASATGLSLTQASMVSVVGNSFLSLGTNSKSMTELQSKTLTNRSTHTLPLERVLQRQVNRPAEKISDLSIFRQAISHANAALASSHQGSDLDLASNPPSPNPFI